MKLFQSFDKKLVYNCLAHVFVLKTTNNKIN